MDKQKTTLTRRLFTATTIGGALSAAACAARAGQDAITTPAPVSTAKEPLCAGPSSNEENEWRYWRLQLQFEKDTTWGLFKQPGENEEKLSRYWYRSKNGIDGWQWPCDSSKNKPRMLVGHMMRIEFGDPLYSEKVRSCHYSVTFGHSTEADSTTWPTTAAPPPPKKTFEVVGSPFLTVGGSAASVLQGEAVTPGSDTQWFMTPWWNVETGVLNAFEFSVGLVVVYSDNTQRQYGYDPEICVGRTCT